MSFMEETKEIQDWLQRQFSGQMNSSDYDPSRDMDQAAAVAAASYVICCLEQTEELNLPIRDDPEAAPIRPPRRSKTADSIEKPRNSSKKVSDKFYEIENDGRRHGRGQDGARISIEDDEDAPRKYPPILKPPTFADVNNVKPEISEPKSYLPWVEPGLTEPESSRPKPGPVAVKKPDLPKSQPHKPKPVSEALTPELPPIFRPPPPPPPGKTKTQRSKIPESEFNSLADTWERSELEKTKRRYEKLKDRITSWEDRKKAKARRKLEKTEDQPEHKRRRALQKFRDDMEFIDEIAKGAREQSEGRRREEVMKVRGKANAIRATGKVPRTCWCL